MALANLVTAVKTELDLERVAPPPLTAPAIAPAPAPAYIPPVSVPMNPNPYIAPPPPYQFMGEGGTPFGDAPELYVPPDRIIPPPPDRRFGWVWTGAKWEFTPVLADYDPPPIVQYDQGGGAVAKPYVLPMRPGEDSLMPVPGGDVPTRPDVAPTVEQVQTPAPAGTGPFKGNFLGADLSIVPLWAWLVGAALLGARVLKG